MSILRSKFARRGIAAAAIASVAMLAAGATGASAHVGVDHDEITAGASTVLTFSIGHGCEGDATNSMKFQVPEAVVNAQPVVKPGWDIAIERAPLATPIEATHGDPQTDRVAVITFTAQDGYAVDNAFRDNFSLSLRAPEAPGDLFFKVVQGCATGENAWIEEWDGTGTEPEHPAPVVKVVAAAEGTATGDHATDTTDATGAADGAPATTVVDVADDGDSDDSSNGLAIVALVVGALGLAVGGASLARSRRPAA